MCAPSYLRTTASIKLGKPTIHHPEIVQMFEDHCKSGRSPRSFIPYIFGGAIAYQWMFRNNAAFRAVNDTYKKKEPVSKLYGRRGNQEISAT
jgi:hypothetical protein